MNAKEFEVFTSFCPYYDIEHYPSLSDEVEWVCRHTNITTLNSRCSRYSCPLLKHIKETDKD